MELGRTFAIGLGVIVDIAISVGYGLRCLSALRDGRGRTVVKVDDDIILYEDRAKAYLKSVMKEITGLNKDVTEEQLVRAADMARRVVSDVVSREIRNIRKGARSWD